MTILVTGGAGYIGSVTVELLRSHGREVVVLDNLSRGHREAVEKSVPFYQGDVGDREMVAHIIGTHEISACLHFAAFAHVSESVEQPGLYFENNVTQGMALLSALLAGGVKKIVFSSSCATYGEPNETPIKEDHPQRPTNPYGWSKLLFERLLRVHSKELNFVGLRYFNAAGATTTHGERHEPETHLIPIVLEVAAGKRPVVEVFGSDYPTPDGTAIRDYVHVSDIADAHDLALAHLERGGTSDFFNLGMGHGYSVIDVIEAAREVTKRRIETKFLPRRPGDPGRLIASSGKARRELGWQPKYTNLESIIDSAWRWMN